MDNYPCKSWLQRFRSRYLRQDPRWQQSSVILRRLAWIRPASPSTSHSVSVPFLMIFCLQPRAHLLLCCSPSFSTYVYRMVWLALKPAPRSACPEVPHPNTLRSSHSSNEEQTKEEKFVISRFQRQFLKTFWFAPSAVSTALRSVVQAEYPCALCCPHPVQLPPDSPIPLNTRKSL